ncbi:MAG TPA: hypothetical protein VF380_04340 [Solirubrobacteraceae bacterium]
MKQLRNKLTVGATVLSLGGLTGVAMSAGGRKSDQRAVPAADIRTVTTQQTIRRYRHLGAGGSSNGTWAQSGAVFAVAHAPGTAVRTRASGAKTAYRQTANGTRPAVKSGPSGTHRTNRGKHSTSGVHGASPTTHPSGSKPAGGKAAPAASNPTTKASGSTGETGSTQTSPAPPATKPSGAPAGGETGGGTPTTPPPPSTKPSGAPGGGEGKGGEGGEPKGGEGKGERGDN